MSDIADITKFFFELGTLKRTERAGWSVTGISKPEVIAAHAYRAVVIGYMLAELEKCDKNKVMRMLMFHDIPETRIGDLHKVAASYLNSEEGEAKAAADQSKLLPSSVGNEYVELNLEAAVTAKEYLVNGYKHSEEFLERIRKVMVTQSAKKLLAEIEKSDGFWWKGLKKNV
ncbi:MAG: HD domain-containing protein [Candidatus Aenigmarchaeota archaeon]|nr:HD domain-containing protein [Candidatus Aenigmarchaeota archaeon]